MEQFNQYQNIAELEGGGIQDRFEEIKYLLTLFGIPWYTF